MRDLNRIIPFCNKLAELWSQNMPDWRFGQFLVNFLCWLGRDPFYLEDDVLMEKIEGYVLSLKSGIE